MKNTFTIESPCHPGHALFVDMATEGRQYLTYEVADGFSCMHPDCYNQWDRNGAPIN